MKVSLNWIRDFVDIDADARTFAEVLTGTGTKAESFEELSADLKNIVVGKILSTEKHPNADRLTVCRTDIGSEQPVQVITAATNVFPGAMVPVCLEGAVLRDGTKIRRGKLRGLISEGMFCSIDELGLTKNDVPYAPDDGILILKEDCRVGQDIRDALMMRDSTVDFELTFNRPDCLGFIGIAREAAASFRKPLKLKAPEYKTNPSLGKVTDYIGVEVRNTKLCPRYTAAVVKNVKIASSPLWMRARLRAAEVRPINNIVDITNYVMLEYGQPMHAFDYGYITSGRIVVRSAEKGESITTIDGVKHELGENMLCIADGEKPVALAGVMGGLNSEILDSTDTVVFESANFDRSNIRLTSRECGLRTESSSRFEKGLPVCNALPALQRAMELVCLLGCGEVVDGVIDVCSADIGERRIPFEPRRINSLLGTSLSRGQMEKILLPLEMRVEGDSLVVPPFRADMERTADAAEEVARMYGFDKIKTTLYKGEIAGGGYTAPQKFRANLKNAAAANGFYEIETYSFISPSAYDRIGLPADDPRRNSIKLLNPLGEDRSVMRTMALPSVLEAAAYNRNRKVSPIALFELATVYFPTEDGLSDERKQLVMTESGSDDFYGFKGSVEAVLDAVAVRGFSVRSAAEPAFHPGVCAVLKKGETVLGSIGQLHPAVSAEYGLAAETYAAVLDVEALYKNAETEKQFRRLPAFPALTRDLALVMDERLEAGEIADLIKRDGGKALESVRVFDVYRGEGVPKGKKSVAYSLSFRLPDRTLSDSDADSAVSGILSDLEAEKGIVLRS